MRNLEQLKMAASVKKITITVKFMRIILIKIIGSQLNDDLRLQDNDSGSTASNAIIFSATNA